MSGTQSRYWLIEHRRLVAEPDEMSTEDFALKDYVCCEVPVGEGFDWALEVFTSRDGAAAEARGIESLGRRKHLDMAEAHRGWTREERYDATVAGELVELSGIEVFEVLESSGVPYVLLDPSAVDRPVTGRLHIEPASAFANRLKRRLLASLRED
jgi:hypothetical protein